MTANAFLRAAHCDLARAKELLAQNPAYLEARGADGETPLGAASHGNQPEIIAFLCEQGVPLDIFAAIVGGWKSQVAAFLAADPILVKAKAPHAHNYPILYFAAISGQVAIADLLLAHGADVNAEERGITALHGAAEFGSLPMVRWLIEHGAQVDAWTPLGGTPLHRAAWGGHQAIAAELLAHGADPLVRTRDGESPLALALERGHQTVAEMLQGRS